MTYSDYIYRLMELLQGVGVTIHDKPDCLPFNGGMYRSETREIFLNVGSAEDALITLCHEAGHWAGYMVREKPHSYQRERQAFVYGWYVLHLIGANSLVSREQWLAHERERREMVAMEEML